MALKLKVSFDGSVPGIVDYRLDLVAFGDALKAFADGLRRTASGLVKEALGPQMRGPVAKRGDLHIFLEDIAEGSLGLAMSVEPPDIIPYNLDLIEDLPARSVKNFVSSIEAESRGALRSDLARRFLRALPKGLTGQRYEAYLGPTQVLDVQIGEVNIPDDPVDLPVAVRITARVIGVTFDPNPEVRLEVGTERMTFAATDALVSTAIRLHDVPVLAVGTFAGNRGRLFWLDRPEAFPVRLGKKELSDHLLSRWEGTLERLSR